MSVPKHKIYASDGVTLVYTINNVIRRDPPIALDVPKEIAITNLRSSGEITIEGGLDAYDITLEFLLTGSDYAAVMSAINTFKTTVLVKTNYYLKYDKNLINDNSLESIRVRLKSIQIDPKNGQYTKYAYVTIVMRALSW